MAPSPASKQSCPQCQRASIAFLQNASLDTLVWYFRCDDCGCIWNVRKEPVSQDGPTDFITINRDGAGYANVR